MKLTNSTVRLCLILAAGLSLAACDDGADPPINTSGTPVPEPQNETEGDDEPQDTDGPSNSSTTTSTSDTQSTTNDPTDPVESTGQQETTESEGSTSDSGSTSSPTDSDSDSTSGGQDESSSSGDPTTGDTGSGEVPKGWTCAEKFYDVLDGCDCGCGIVDPDCIDSTVDSCTFCGPSFGSCATDAECTNVDPNDNSQCTDQ